MIKYFTLVFIFLLTFSHGQNLVFTTDKHTLKNWRFITNALIKQGFILELENFKIDNDGSLISLYIKGDKRYNFKALLDELSQSNIYIKNRYIEDKIEYIELDSTKGVLKTELLELDSTTTINRSGLAQWFRVPYGSNSLRIEAPYDSKWFVLVAFFDANLKPLESIRLQESKESLELEVPQGASYLKFSNLYGMKMLKGSSVLEVLR